MENKVLIAHCQKLGMNVKDSALASISEEERDRVLAYIRQGPGESSAKSEALAPTREPVKPVVVGKVPTIRAPLARGPLAREMRRESEPTAPAAGEAAPGPAPAAPAAAG